MKRSGSSSSSTWGRIRIRIRMIASTIDGLVFRFGILELSYEVLDFSVHLVFVHHFRPPRVAAVAGAGFGRLVPNQRSLLVHSKFLDKGLDERSCGSGHGFGSRFFVEALDPTTEYRIPRMRHDRSALSKNHIFESRAFDDGW